VNPTPAHVAKQWTPEDFMVYAAEGVALGTSVIIRWTTSSEGRANGLRYQQLKSPLVSYSKMENVPMAPHCYLGHEASPWHVTSQFLTPMLSCT